MALVFFLFFSLVFVVPESEFTEFDVKATELVGSVCKVFVHAYVDCHAEDVKGKGDKLGVEHEFEGPGIDNVA